jgi:hypothetical protein
MGEIPNAIERTETDIRTNPPLILTKTEAGCFLHLSVRKIEGLIKSRSLASVKIDGSIRVRLQDINQFVESRVIKGVIL